MRILLVQLADIGNLVLTTPALVALREAQPDAHLTLLTSAHAAPVVENTGLVDAIVTLERRTFNSSRALLNPANLRLLRHLHGHDTVVFFHHFTLKLGTFKFALIAAASGAKRRIGLQNGSGWFLTDSIADEGFGACHEAEYALRLVGLLGADGSSRPAQVNIDASLPLPTHEGPRVVLHAGSGGYSLARRWDPVYFAQVADTLQREHNAQVIIVGGSDDNAAEVDAHMETTPLNLAGKTTLPQLAGVIQQADLFIGADSGVMHIASATGTPIIAVFGPSNHRAWSPWTPNGQSLVVRSGPLCSPCSYVDHHIGLREGCPARTCMRMVTPEVVLRAVVRYIEQGQLPTADALPPGPTSRRTVEILGLPVDAITYPQWLDTIEQWVHSGKPHHVCTLNPEFVMIAQRDPNFQHILQRADLCVPDGVGLLWAARYLGQPLPGRVTGSDGVPIIAERAARQGWRLYLLGAAPGVAARAADILQSRYPGLQIAGVYSGSPTPEAEDDIVRRVNNSDANILLVAYGAPQQDTWIARNLPRLEVQMAMGVGGAFDFIAGVIPRAPLWMRRAGLEWLYRLYLQPSRIGRMTRLPRFVLAVILRGKKR